MTGAPVDALLCCGRTVSDTFASGGGLPLLVFPSDSRTASHGSPAVTADAVCIGPSDARDASLASALGFVRGSRSSQSKLLALQGSVTGGCGVGRFGAREAAFEESEPVLVDLPFFKYSEVLAIL